MHYKFTIVITPKQVVGIQNETNYYYYYTDITYTPY